MTSNLIFLISDLPIIVLAMARKDEVYEDLLGFILIVLILLFALGVVILMVTRWISGPAPGDRKSGYATALRVAAWFITILGFIGGTVLIGPLLWWFAAIAVIATMAYGKRVATQQYAMLALVGVAADRSIPLETAFAAFGRECGGWMRERAAEIVQILRSGASLTDALEAVPGVLPPEAVPLVCVGYENGSLGPAISEAISARKLLEPAWQSIVPKIGYICALPVFAGGIVVFLCLKIFPQFQKIFRDFGIRLPDATRWLLYAANFADNAWPLLVMAWLIVVGLFMYAVLRYAGAIRWDLPGMAWLLRRRHVATVLDALALAAQRERPLGTALSTLASVYPQRSIGRRLRAVCDDIKGGGDELHSLYSHGLLGKADLALLQAAKRNGNFAWAASEMADSNRRRLIYRLNTVVQAVFPLVVVGYGLLVAWVATAVIYPLAALILRLTPS